MAYYNNQGYGGSNPNVVFTQPGQPMQNVPLPPGMPTQWMQKPQPIPGCPVGLEYLLQVDSLQVKQLPSLLEAFTGWDTNNKYEINNAAGQKVFFAAEESETCMRVCCQEQRGFTIHVIDNLNQEVMRISREFKCCAGCCWCAGCCNGCAHEVVVEAPVGNVVGYVRQKGSCWIAKYDILDENRECVLKIRGPCCILDGACCPCENEFRVLSRDESTQVGKISKVYAGFIKEAFTTADTFGINFPMDLSVKAKATMLGALFLIDFMFFETKDNHNNDN